MLHWQHYDLALVSALKEVMSNTHPAFLYKHGPFEKSYLITQLTAADGMRPSIRKTLTVPFTPSPWSPTGRKAGTSSTLVNCLLASADQIGEKKGV